LDRWMDGWNRHQVLFK